MKSVEQIAQECCELFGERTSRNHMPWKELPNLYKDGWEAVVLHVLQVQAQVSDGPAVATEPTPIHERPVVRREHWYAVISEEGDFVTEVFSAGQSTIILGNMDNRRAVLDREKKVYILQ